MNLFEISQQYIDFCNAVENGDIPEEAIPDTLESLEGDFKAKADNIAGFIKSLEYDASSLEQEAKTLSERAKGKKTKAQSLRQYLFRQMQDTGLSRIDTPRNLLSIRKNPPKVTITQENEFILWAQQNGRDDLLKFSDPAINKKEVAAQIKLGNTMPGCSIVQEFRLDIK